MDTARFLSFLKVKCDHWIYREALDVHVLACFSDILQNGVVLTSYLKWGHINCFLSPHTGNRKNIPPSKLAWPLCKKYHTSLLIFLFTFIVLRHVSLLHQTANVFLYIEAVLHNSKTRGWRFFFRLSLLQSHWDPVASVWRWKRLMWMKCHTKRVTVSVQLWLVGYPVNVIGLTAHVCSRSVNHHHQNGGNEQNNYKFINSPTLTFFWSHPKSKIMTASDFCMHVIACDLYDGWVYWDQKGPKNGPK